jgi:hypothetical protein
VQQPEAMQLAKEIAADGYAVQRLVHPARVDRVCVAVASRQGDPIEVADPRYWERVKHRAKRFQAS